MFPWCFCAGAEPPPPPWQVLGWAGMGNLPAGILLPPNPFLEGTIEHSFLDVAGRFLLEVQQMKGFNLSVSGWGRDLFILQAAKSSSIQWC